MVDYYYNLDDPRWDKAGRIHDWRNYATEELKAIWHTFTIKQKQVIYHLLNELASREEYD